MVKKVFLFLIFFNSLLNGFNLKDGSIEFLIQNSKKIIYYEHLKLNFELPYDKVKFYFSIGNNLNNTFETNNIKILVWKIDIYYYPKNNLYIGIGDRYLNYSPFVLYSEKWNDNSFKGLFVNYFSRRYKLQLDGFVGLHSEDTNKMKFNGEYLKTDIGYINKYFINKIQTESPSIWGALKIEKKWTSFYSNKIVYVYENYSLEKQHSLFNSYYFFYNNIFQSDFIFNYKKINFTISPILMIKSYYKYNGYGDYYGTGKHKLMLDYTEKKNIFSGYIKLSFSKLYNLFLLNGFHFIEYRYMEKDFIPVYMDNGRIKENRGEDFLNNILIEEKGYILHSETPLFNKNIVGYEYYYFISTLNLKKYYEQRYFTKLNILHSNLLILFYHKNGFLSDFGNISNLQGFALNLSVNISNYFILKVIYTENKWNIKNNNILELKTTFYF